MFTIVCITILKLCLHEHSIPLLQYLPHVVIQVPIVAKEDKRQITAVTGITMFGVVLPPQTQTDPTENKPESTTMLGKDKQRTKLRDMPAVKKVQTKTEKRPQCYTPNS